MDNQKLEELISSQKEIVGLLAILAKRDTMQSTLMKELSMVGFQPKRIAELLGTTPNTISVSLNRVKKLKK